MHTLRFHNSGIRANVFIRKIGFKLCVMRLNHVESFYAFLLRFRSEGNEEEGQQGMARPPIRGRSAIAKAPYKGAVSYGQAPYKWRPLEEATAARGHDRLRPARKGLSPTTRLQGAVARSSPARGGHQRPGRKGAAAHGAPARGRSPAARPRPALPPA
ncbi:hypothetical protein B296_00016916 [Ensete ventricosum]|uniref:Uncharacterized protein n=1 Tax=Ensete ventricosum TaxID=4639 RepID=A0A426XCW5_ENSVE|nr:hypothetical protein B296_00016916 [Ensete ventricosum]